MANEFKLSYTGSEINTKLGKIDSLEQSVANLKSSIPSKISDLTNDSDFATKAYVDNIRALVVCVDLGIGQIIIVKNGVNTSRFTMTQERNVENSDTWTLFRLTIEQAISSCIPVIIQDSALHAQTATFSIHDYADPDRYLCYYINNQEYRIGIKSDDKEPT